jgi:medium-chain acyl-[acyl-carrier-protein] hydrolase
VSDAWLTLERRTETVEVHLVTLPHAGGAASVYRSWSAWLPPEVDICLAHLPGRERRIGEPAHNRIESLVGELADHLRLVVDRPYVLFGHSMGAIVAYELTRALAPRGFRPPAGLIVSGQRAPHRPDDSSHIHHLPDADFLGALRELGGTPSEVFEHPELIELLLPTLRADFAAIETYEWVPGPPLEIPIVAFAGDRDEVIDPDDVAGWAEQTTAPIIVERFDGGHFFVLDRPEQVARCAGEHALALAAGQAP